MRYRVAVQRQPDHHRPRPRRNTRGGAALHPGSRRIGLCSLPVYSDQLIKRFDGDERSRPESDDIELGEDISIEFTPTYITEIGARATYVRQRWTQ
jgi:hypothetical protein